MILCGTCEAIGFRQAFHDSGGGTSCAASAEATAWPRALGLTYFVAYQPWTGLFEENGLFLQKLSLWGFSSFRKKVWLKT